MSRSYTSSPPSGRAQGISRWLLTDEARVCVLGYMMEKCYQNRLIAYSL
jgi:hypothetical protein